MSDHTVNRYRENQIMTASREQILLALYDGAIRFAQQACDAIAARDPAAKGKAIGRAIAIVGELNGTLDHGKAPELCANLSSIYNYMLARLNEGSAKMQTAPIEEVIGHLQGLRETWQKAIFASAHEQPAV